MLRKAFGLLAEARAKGPREGIRHIGHRLYEAFHERRLGIRSAGVLSPTELGFGDPDLQEYMPVTYRNFRFIMARVAIDPLRDVFLDLGCGMGRAVVLAATRPFRQVVGVEIVPSLAQIARENVARAANMLICNNMNINI